MKMPDMDKKVGPFNVGTWLIILAAGIGIAWYMTRGSGVDENYTDDERTYLFVDIWHFRIESFLESECCAAAYFIGCCLIISSVKRSGVLYLIDPYWYPIGLARVG